MELYSDRLKKYLESIEDSLHSYFPDEDKLSGETVRAMKYSIEAGGKRIRPVLVLTWADICGGKESFALPFACALEMVHSYSLIHDDMPCMDDSPLRRGKPSVHKEFGEDIALLAGDGLLTRAFEIILNPSICEKMNPEDRLAAAFTLADAAGVNGMVGGQNLDLTSEGKNLDFDSIVLLQSGKTAALIRAACVMGAQVSGAKEETVRAAAVYGENLGMAFQVVDDILDVTSTSADLGKPVNHDVECHKNTMVSLLGLEEAKKIAKDFTQKAIDALTEININSSDLIDLAQKLISRIN